jgi:molecular chaperone IbpA
MGQLTCLTKRDIMTKVEVFNNLSKQLHMDHAKFFDDSFESMTRGQKHNHFAFYNVVKYSKGKYGLEIGLAGYNKENILVEVKDGILTVEGKVEDKNIAIYKKV